MKELMIGMISPDFLQGMAAATLCFLIPQRKRPHWAVFFVLSLAAFFAPEFIITMSMDDRWYSPVAYIFPVLFPVVTLMLCADCTVTQAIYGAACAYAAQHVAFCAVMLLWGDSTGTRGIAGGWVIHIVVLALIYRFVAVKLPVDGRYQVTLTNTLLTAGLVLLLALFLSYNSFLKTAGMEDQGLYRLYRLSDFFSCLFILFLQLDRRREVGLLAAVETEQRLRAQMAVQYALTRENIDIINRKSHDLKHQVSALRLVKDPADREASLREIEDSVQIYDTNTHTGNEVLDTVLMEKGLLCRTNGINWTCMAQGEGLEFISPVDLYTLLGNALDNAIESSRVVADPERRVIRVTIRQNHGAAFFQVENFYEGDLSMSDGLPQTTKGDVQNHGFGLQSIRAVVQRYGGTMDIEADDERFLLTVLIPVLEKQG